MIDTLADLVWFVGTLTGLAALLRGSLAVTRHIRWRDRLDAARRPVRILAAAATEVAEISTPERRGLSPAAYADREARRDWDREAVTLAKRAPLPIDFLPNGDRKSSGSRDSYLEERTGAARVPWEPPIKSADITSLAKRAREQIPVYDLGSAEVTYIPGREIPSGYVADPITAVVEIAGMDRNAARYVVAARSTYLGTGAIRLGYPVPAVATLQHHLGVHADGVWGPRTEAAFVRRSRR